MNKAIAGLAALIILIGGFFLLNKYIYNEKQGDTSVGENATIEVDPVSHATMVLKWGDKIIYTDPVGGTAAFANRPEPDLILITDIHGDHLNPDTIRAVAKDKTTIVVPKAVADQLANTVPGNMMILNNGEVINQQGFSIQAIPMYNVPESATAPHIKGRGNGYVLEAGGQRIYIAGDTGNTPEMRALEDIDLAFVPMNLPFTMSVEDAAQAVLAFKPKKVIPYHYRGQDGLSDTNKFKQLVNTGDSSIQVDLLNFYPDPQGTDSWKTATDTATGATYRYPEQLTTKYISVVDWPPQVKIMNGAFSCTEAGLESDRAGKTEKRMVGNRTYCVTSIMEGAAGSVYTQYAYSFAKDSKVVTLTFSLRAPQCENYDGQERTACLGERETFDIDSVLDQIAQTLKI